MPKAGRAREWVLLLSVATVVAFLLSLLFSTNGHFVPQVVDLYLVCQYARAFAEGHPFHYNVGEPPSTGATSPLYTAFLGLLHFAGVRGEALVAAAILTGATLYVCSVALAYRVGSRLSSERAGILSALLVGLGGATVWGFLYGSDIAAFMFLSLWLFERLVSREGGGEGWVLPSSLLALLRPEGLLIGLGLGIVESRRARRLVAWVPLALGVTLLGLERLLTGQWLGSSLADKSLFANYNLRDSTALVTEYLMGVVRGLFLGVYPPEARIGFAKGWAPFYFPPLALLFILVAAMRGKAGSTIRFWMGLVGVVYLITAPNMYLGVHFNRYLMWAFPTLLVLTAVGFADFAAIASRGDETLETKLFRAGAILMVLCGLLSTARFAALYGELAGEVNRRDVAAAQWISAAMQDGRLPKGARMANVATSVEYLTGHRNLNLHGVTAPGFFGNRPGEREAEVFETLGRLSAEDRPEFLISSEHAQETYPSLKSLVREPPLFETTSGSDEILIYQMNYEVVGRNQSLYLPESLERVRGLTEVDRLNVCDSRDEAGHHYVYRSHLGDLDLNGTVRKEAYRLSEGERLLIDAGRGILGEESFQIRTHPGHDLIVVLRTSDSVGASALRVDGPVSLGIGFAEAGFRVFVDGQAWNTITFRPRPGWEEVSFRIPSALIKGSATSLRLAGRYTSFYYWFYQAGAS